MPTEITESILSLISGVSADIFGALGCVFLLIALGLSKGKDTLIVFLLALYPAGIIAEYFPFYQWFSDGGNSLFNTLAPVIVFLGSLLAVIFIIKGYIDTNYQHRTFWRVVEVVVLSVTSIGLSIALLHHVVGISSFYNFSIVFQTLFSSGTALFIWIVAPLLSIPLFVRV